MSPQILVALGLCVLVAYVLAGCGEGDGGDDSDGRAVAT
jgi:hypothetical protein